MAVKTTRPEQSGGTGVDPPRGQRVWPYRTQLRNGTPIAVRPLVPEDVPKLEAIVSRLSPLSRYLRYLTPLEHLPRQAVHELCQVDGHHHLALIAEVEEDGVEHPVGIARAIRVGPEAKLAEVAAEVVDEWQRCGVGTLLLTVLAASAVDAGIERWHAVMFAHNIGIRKAIGGVADLVSERQAGYGLVEAIYELHRD